MASAGSGTFEGRGEIEAVRVTLGVEKEEGVLVREPSVCELVAVGVTLAVTVGVTLAVTLAVGVSEGCERRSWNVAHTKRRRTDVVATYGMMTKHSQSRG